jgi:hypothetical protein
MAVNGTLLDVADSFNPAARKSSFRRHLFAFRASLFPFRIIGGRRTLGKTRPKSKGSRCLTCLPRRGDRRRLQVRQVDCNDFNAPALPALDLSPDLEPAPGLQLGCQLGPGPGFASRSGTWGRLLHRIRNRSGG